MRIDKYLKNSRIIKRRTIAKEACDSGKIEINGKIAKSGTEVKIGDEISISLGTKKMIVEILSLEEHVTKDMSKDMYKIKG